MTIAAPLLNVSESGPRRFEMRVCWETNLPGDRTPSSKDCQVGLLAAHEVLNDLTQPLRTGSRSRESICPRSSPAERTLSNTEALIICRVGCWQTQLEGFSEMSQVVLDAVATGNAAHNKDISPQ